MTDFRTTIPPMTFPFDFKHQLPLLCMGSCFAEHIGAKLTSSKFQTLINPLGILYNPYSIGNALDSLLKGHLVKMDDLVSANGLWHSFDHHGHFSKPNPADTLRTINDQIAKASLFLKKTKRLLITFGTSNAFVYKKTEQIVANCHKFPGQNFKQTTLSSEVIFNQLCPLFEQLKRLNPELEILLTVSPVRHIRDGLIENQRSKARLLLACEQLSKGLDFVHYFPAYEILIDDLRDYRFYAKDMIHPSEVAVEYIWDYFGQCFFDTITKDLNARIHKVTSAAKHRPFNPQTSAHQLFLKKQTALIGALETDYPFLDFEEETHFFNNQLIDL